MGDYVDGNGLGAYTRRASGTRLGYTWSTPEFAYSLKCTLCRHETAHTVEQHNILTERTVIANLSDYTPRVYTNSIHLLLRKDAQFLLNGGQYPLRDVLTTAQSLLTYQGTQADLLQVAACEQYIHDRFYSSWLDEMAEREANKYV